MESSMGRRGDGCYYIFYAVLALFVLGAFASNPAIGVLVLCFIGGVVLLIILISIAGGG